MNIEGLISDLAFILLLGAIVSVLFKYLKQPVVLGYIVAGFLASPHFKYLPSVTTEENIDFWAQIGIVILLFSIGLEFSFKKLVSAGGSAIVTALFIIIGMMSTGFAVGHLILHFNTINSLFLGGMLSMSSTTIIIKAFTDLGLRQKKFASQVLAVLIVEDLFAVLMMFLLSSIAINKSVEGSELLFSIGKLIFFLVIWFLIGVAILPTLLNRIRKHLNQETLLIVSMGLCLGMAVLSVACGFSLALGAFVMGSILAGTSYAERIEHVVTPVKDLFGAVFFISVGMLVQTDILIHYWSPILLLSAVVIIGMIIFGTFGMLLTGQTLKVAIESGFSLTQIGEFAFIIATLGMSLNVLDQTIYPIVVAVSVITTFLTPYFIKMAVPVYNFLEKHLPQRLNFLINRYQKQADPALVSRNVWSAVLKRYIWRTAVYCIILIAIIITCNKYINPMLIEYAGQWSKILGLCITLSLMSPFLLALISPLQAKGDSASTINSITGTVPRIVMMSIRYIIAIAMVVKVISSTFSSREGIVVGIAVIVIIILYFSNRLRDRMNKIETKFLDNLNERELRRSGKKNAVVNDLHLAHITVGTACEFLGDRLMDSNLRKRFGINIVSIQRGNRTIPIPNGRARLYPGDVIGIIGTDEQIEQILPSIESNLPEDTNNTPITLTAIHLSENSPLINQTPQTASLRDNYEAIVVAVDRGNEHLESRPDIVFHTDDIVWLVGNPDKLKKLK